MTDQLPKPGPGPNPNNFHIVERYLTSRYLSDVAGIPVLCPTRDAQWPAKGRPRWVASPLSPRRVAVKLAERPLRVGRTEPWFRFAGSSHTCVRFERAGLLATFTSRAVEGSSFASSASKSGSGRGAMRCQREESDFEMPSGKVVPRDFEPPRRTLSSKASISPIRRSARSRRSIARRAASFAPFWRSFAPGSYTWPLRARVSGQLARNQLPCFEATAVSVVARNVR